MNVSKFLNDSKTLCKKHGLSMRGLMACVSLYEGGNQPMRLVDFASDIRPGCWSDLLGKTYSGRLFVMSVEYYNGEPGAPPKTITLSAFGAEKISELVACLQ